MPSYTETAAVGVTNGTTEVELVAAPTGGATRTVFTARITNVDTVSRKCYISVKQSGTTYAVIEGTVAQDETQAVPDRIVLGSGQSLVCVLDGVPATEWDTYVAYAEFS